MLLSIYDGLGENISHNFSHDIGITIAFPTYFSLILSLPNSTCCLRTSAEPRNLLPGVNILLRIIYSSNPSFNTFKPRYRYTVGQLGSLQSTGPTYYLSKKLTQEYLVANRPLYWSQYIPAYVISYQEHSNICPLFEPECHLKTVSSIIPKKLTFGSDCLGS